MILPVFTLLEVNYPRLRPQSQLAVVALLGLVLCFLRQPDGEPSRWRLWLDRGLAAVAAAVCLYVVVQTEPLFSALWPGDSTLGDRAGAETTLDLVVGGAGLLVILEGTRRAIGAALPLLSLAFLAYARFGAALPDWLLPHRGYDLERIVGQTFLHSQGVFGVALQVMFTYVLLFVVLGSLLEATGATQFILRTTRRLLGRTTGGAAKVAVASSGLMGSLSGSAVANTATTGTFTIPMMRSAGFSPQVAAGLEAAASSGGALVPPVMGAGAYMMLEIIDPPVTYLEIIRAALLPACLYYLAIFLIVHFYARRIQAGATVPPVAEEEPAGLLEGVIFAGALAVLVVLLLMGFSVFRAVSLAMLVALALSLLRARTRLSPGRLAQVLTKASRNSVALVVAAACVGIIIGVVTLTGIGGRLPALLLPLAQDNLLGALALLMASSIILGMGLPSAVCYLLLATLVGPALGRLGVPPLAAHLFIFYFGLMSMVTPPVALAAYAASSLAGSPFLPTSLAAFRFALVGFLLPFQFVLRPQLLMLEADGEGAAWLPVVAALALAVVGVVALAGSIAGYLGRSLGWGSRGFLALAAGLTLLPAGTRVLAGVPVTWLNLLGVALVVAAAAGLRWRGLHRSES